MPNEAARNAVNDEWYRDWRRDVEAFFATPNLIANDQTEELSPSGRYRLVIREYDTPPTRNYSRGLVYAGDRLIADVKRNYSYFYHGWSESHANGHDYLLCGEDYQGQTVIELDTGNRSDYIQADAEKGWAFCCAAYHPSPDRKMIVIDGCYWGCPYELVVWRFGDPLVLPWPEVQRVNQQVDTAGWTPDGFVYELSTDIRVDDGKALAELTRAEQDDFWRRRAEIGGARKLRYLRSANGEIQLVGERIVRYAGK